MKKRVAMALFLVMTGMVGVSQAALPDNQWFSELVETWECERICFDPATGEQIEVGWRARVCEFGWSTCRPLSCNISCRELLRMGWY